MSMAPPPPEQDSGDSVDELVLRGKEGDRDAAYDVLGRQVSVDTWVAVIRRLALDTAAADLELVAHRTVR